METLVKDSEVKLAPINTYKAPTPKYDLPWVKDELREMIHIILNDEEIKSKAQLFKLRGYSNKRFSEWRRKYDTNTYVQEYLKKIEEIIESRLIDHGLNAKNPAFVIFMLKNHYGYQDKREVETETTHVFKVSRGDVRSLPNRGKVIDIQPK